MLEKLLVNRRLFVVKFSGSQKFYMDFSNVCGSVPPNSVLFKGQQYFLNEIKKRNFLKEAVNINHIVITTASHIC